MLFYIEYFDINYPRKVDMPLNKETKANQTKKREADETGMNMSI